MWLKTGARRFSDRYMAVALLTLCATIPIGFDNHKMTLMIEKPTEVHSIDQTPSSSDSQSASFQPGKIITILKPGETTRAIGVYHGQDHDGFKVKLADGTEGLILAGDSFKVVSR